MSIPSGTSFCCGYYPRLAGCFSASATPWIHLGKRHIARMSLTNRRNRLPRQARLLRGRSRAFLRAVHLNVRLHMTPPENLFDAVSKIRSRHNRRTMLLLGAILLAFVATLVIPEMAYPNGANETRRIFLLRSGELVVFLLSVASAAFILLEVKRDNIRSGAICPKCGKILYSRRALLFGGRSSADTGLCPSCGYDFGRRKAPLQVSPT